MHQLSTHTRKPMVRRSCATACSLAAEQNRANLKRAAHRLRHRVVRADARQRRGAGVAGRVENLGVVGAGGGHGGAPGGAQRGVARQRHRLQGGHAAGPAGGDGAAQRIALQVQALQRNNRGRECRASLVGGSGGRRGGAGRGAGRLHSQRRRCAGPLPRAAQACRPAAAAPLPAEHPPAGRAGRPSWRAAPP